MGLTQAEQNLFLGLQKASGNLKTEIARALYAIAGQHDLISDYDKHMDGVKRAAAIFEFVMPKLSPDKQGRVKQALIELVGDFNTASNFTAFEVSSTAHVVDADVMGSVLNEKARIAEEARLAAERALRVAELAPVHGLHPRERNRLRLAQLGLLNPPG